MGWISVRNWRKFQHYDPAKRSPPWIKNYTELMSDDAYLGLTFHQRGVLHAIWLEYAASHCQLADGTATDTREHADSTLAAPRQTRDSLATLSRRLGGRVTRATLDALNHAGYIDIVASKALAEGYQGASTALASRAPVRSLETETETETETEPKAVTSTNNNGPGLHEIEELGDTTAASLRSI